LVFVPISGIFLSVFKRVQVDSNKRQNKGLESPRNWGNRARDARENTLRVSINETLLSQTIFMDLFVKEENHFHIFSDH
jgi:hypothetical protein